ncbi:MAG TPA: acyl-CoA dehydrogenase family protein [Chloroflexota bacterium]|nr:acyl-CoA dehydrogenase family protein [Chloroflexota bacterium]
MNRPVYDLKTKPAVLGSHAEAMQAVQGLKPRLRERIPQAESLRHLPPDNVADLLQSGLYGVMTPKRWGGSELGSETLIDASVELASACPSTGWVYMLWAAHMWLLALFPLQAQEELWSNPNMLASSVVNTQGDVVPAEGGFRWTGKGFFSSGVDHCNWLTALIGIKREEGQPPERAWLLLQREQFEIVDDWFTMGLKGTGSKTIVINDAFIPQHRYVSAKDIEEGVSPGASLHPNPVYCAPSTANFTAAMGSPAVGAAKGFLELFEERLRTRARTTTMPAQADGLLSNMNRLASSIAQVEAVHALSLENARRYASIRASTVSLRDRMACMRDQAFAAQSSRRVVNQLWEESGGSNLFEKSELQRFWHDTNAAAAHQGLTWDWIGTAWSKIALGLSEGPFV